MEFKKILILGSTYLTELAVNRLLDRGYNLIGYVPSKRAVVSGIMPLPEMNINTKCDMLLSIQYDLLVNNPKNAYNLHTGLLPDYGGLDILRHTLQNNEYEQGLTFHKMSERYDDGPIISKITYPVFKHDTAQSLYERQCEVVPDFILSCMSLLASLDTEEVDNCHRHKPRILKRVFDLNPIAKPVNKGVL